ncbi:hypothetical protein [Kitasatospora sp. NPDC056181]|uniref:hypothetical protein n=1 Tax=Kitasatospora sp. NPDC056181 TaxID=3345737 RepID=UPI0035D5C21A
MTITPRLVARYPFPDRDGARTFVDPTGPAPRLEVRGAGSLRIYDLKEQAELTAEFPAPPPGRWSMEWTAPDLSFAVFGTATEYVAVARDGTTLWKQPYGTWDVGRWGYLDFSTTGAASRPAATGSSAGGPGQDLRIWLRLPSGLPDSTLILTLDAEGTVLARSVLPCGGYERFVSLLWDENDEVCGVTVSEGRAALTRYEARWQSGAIVLGGLLPQDRGALLWSEREYLGTDAGNTRCMSVDRRGRDVSWHSLPTYRVTASLGLGDFPAPGTGDCSVHNAPYISSSSSGFVDDDTALVTLYNPYDEAAVYMFGRDGWREHSHWLADPATGALHGRIEYPMAEVDNVTLVGDGTWITEEWDAYYRWRR